MFRMRAVIQLALIVCLAVSCASPATSTTGTSPSPPTLQTETRTTSPAPSETPAPNPAHVFVIVMENATLATALRSPTVERLAAKYELATHYNAVSHPSLPNYLAMTSGSTWGITDDGYHALPAGGLGAQLTAAGISWRAYMEGMTSGACLSNTALYAVKHNPFAYYGGRCPAQVVPFTQFSRDISGSVPRFVWITPNMCHDGHDCSTATADAWLAQTVPTILATKAWKEGGVLFLTWDEGED